MVCITPDTCHNHSQYHLLVPFKLEENVKIFKNYVIHYDETENKQKKPMIISKDSNKFLRVSEIPMLFRDGQDFRLFQCVQWVLSHFQGF